MPGFLKKVEPLYAGELAALIGVVDLGAQAALCAANLAPFAEPIRIINSVAKLRPTRFST